MLTYLALGDSYTIGEQVPVYESFPYQLVQLLRAGASKFWCASADRSQIFVEIDAH